MLLRMGTPGERYVVAGVAQTLLRAASIAGVDRSAVLAEARLSEMDIADRDAHITIEAQGRLGRAVLSRLPRVNFGLMAANAVTPASMGAVGYVISSSATLDGALKAFCRYQRLISDGIALASFVEPGCVKLVLTMEPEIEAMKHPVEAIFAAWITMARQITGAPCNPLRARFRHAPVGDPAEHEAFFQAPVEFEADENAMQVPADVLALPVRESRLDRHSMFVAHAESLLAELRQGGLTAQVSAHVVTALSAGSVQQAEIAAALGMSARTLSRRLRDEGTTFGEVLEQVRRDLALRYLKASDCAVYEVAFLLGYREPSTFHRSFRRWTGRTPSDYRRSAD
jgi:AraC-like DNA-binding protein